MIILSLFKMMFTKPRSGKKLPKPLGGFVSPARSTTPTSKRDYSPNRMPVAQRRCLQRPRDPRTEA